MNKKNEGESKMLKHKLKLFMPEEILQAYYGFQQKRFEHQMSIPTKQDVLTVGAYTYGSENINIFFRDSGEKVEIGKFCSIAKNITILLGGGHRHDWVTTFPFGHVSQTEFGNEKMNGHPMTKGSVIIGSDVWIGMGTTIMPGVKIGDGAVIAANSHIVTDIPPYGIVGGNPGKLIKLRFDSETISRLLKIKWWDFPNTEINSIKMKISQKPQENILRELESIRSELN
jgi:acetyltransferase-like isoleucine patch superfamily enzyme